MLVNPMQFIKAAASRGVAVPAFNVHNLDIMQAAVNAAADANSPVIIQLSAGSAEHFGIKYAVACARAASEITDIPIALQIDHCSSYKLLCECAVAGFSSLMVDASHLPYEENIAFVCRVVEFAHAAGISVEAELGRIGGTEDDISLYEREASLTRPDEAADFAKRTGIDMLAISIGTAHGKYRGAPKIDFERISDIKKLVDIPLVMHGASGVPDGDITRAISLGISKINIATQLKTPFAQSLKQTFTENPEQEDPRVFLGAARDAVYAAAQQKITLFGADGLANKL